MIGYVRGAVSLLRFLYLRFLKTIVKDKDAVLYKVYGFIATVFVPTVLEDVLEAATQKMHAVPYLNRSALNIGYGFYFFDSFNAPYY